MAITPYTLYRNRCSHNKHGIYCFVNPILKPYVKVLKVTNYSVSVKIFDEIIRGIYFPPLIKGY